MVFAALKEIEEFSDVWLSFDFYAEEGLECF